MVDWLVYSFSLLNIWKRAIGDQSSSPVYTQQSSVSGYAPFYVCLSIMHMCMTVFVSENGSVEGCCFFVQKFKTRMDSDAV